MLQGGLLNAAYVNQDTDGQPKEWHGVHLKTRTGQEADDDAGEERVVCVVKV